MASYYEILRNMRNRYIIYDDHLQQEQFKNSLVSKNSSSFHFQFHLVCYLFRENLLKKMIVQIKIYH